MKTLDPPCISSPCATDSPPAPTDTASFQSQQLLSLNTTNKQVAALLDELPRPTMPEVNPATDKVEQLRQLQRDYLAQLEQFWTHPNGATGGMPTDQWLARTLETQLRAEAQLRGVDGTLDADDRQLIDQVLSLPTREQRESALPVAPSVHRPGVYDIVFLGADAADTTPWPGAFVITRHDGAALPDSDPDPKQFKGKKAVEIHSDLGRVVLYSLEYGLETFASLRVLHATLQVRIGRKVADRFSASDDKQESLFAWQVQSLRNAQQRQVNDTFAASPADTSRAMLERLEAAADLRDVLDIGSRVNRRSQALQYRIWRQVFKEAGRQDWQRYRVAAGQVQAGRLALALALVNTLPPSSPNDSSDRPIIPDQAALDAIVQALNEKPSVPSSAQRAQAIRETWQYANAACLQLALLDATLQGRIGTRQQQWLEVVLDYPASATRPTIGTHVIVANALGLWVRSEDGQRTLHIIGGGVLAITSADPDDPSVLLHAPDSPDDNDLKVLNRPADIDRSFQEPPWKDYVAARLRKSSTPTLQPPPPGDDTHVELIPMPGNVHQCLYEIQRDALIEQARHPLPGKSASDRQSLLEQWALGTAASQKNAGLIGTFLPGQHWLARTRASGQTDIAALPGNQGTASTDTPQPANTDIPTLVSRTGADGKTLLAAGPVLQAIPLAHPPLGTARLRLLGGAPTGRSRGQSPSTLSRRLSAIAGLVRLGSWSSQVMDIIVPLMPNLAEWPQGSGLLIIDVSDPGVGWSAHYRRGLHEDTYIYRVSPAVFSARHDVVLYRSAANHYRAWLDGQPMSAPAGEDSFFHAVALSLNQGHGAGIFTVERLRNAAADHIERNPDIAPFVTSEHLPLYTRAIEHCLELSIWLGNDRYRALTAILKGAPNPYGLFQPAIRYLETTLPSRSPRISTAVDDGFNSVYERYDLRPLPAEIRRMIEHYIDAPPRPELSLWVDEPRRRALLETLLIGPSQAADIDFLAQRNFIFSDNIRHILLEYGATATQLRLYALQHLGNQTTPRRDLIRAVLGRVPPLLERVDIIFSSATLTPPMEEGLNTHQIAHLLDDQQISTDRLRLIARCADAGIIHINLLENADGIRSLTDDVLSRLLEHQQDLLMLARKMGFQDIAPLLLPFEVNALSWSRHQFQSVFLANARLRILLETPDLFTLLRQRKSARVVDQMWTQLSSSIHDNARVRHALANPRNTLRSLAQLNRALSAALPNTEEPGPSTRSQPIWLRGYEMHGSSTPDTSGPDARGLYRTPDGRTYILHEGLRYEVRAFRDRFRIIHAIDGFRRATYEVRRRADGSWQIMDAPGLGGDVRRPYPPMAEQSRMQRNAFTELGQAAQQEWQRLGAGAAVSGQVPDLHAIESGAAGDTMELIGPAGVPRQHLELEKNSALARLATRIRNCVDTIHQYFEFQNGQLLPRPGVTHHEVVHGLAQLDGLNSLNTGFALLLLNSGRRSALSTELASAVRVQFYTQLAQVVVGVACDGKMLAQAIYLGLKDARHLGAESISLLDKAGQGIRLGGKTLTLGGLLAAGNALLVLASLGVDSYLLTHAESAEEKATYGTNVGLDSLALGTVLAGFAEGAEFLGPLSIPLAGLGLGASSLVSVFFAKAHKVLATGAQFTREVQAYRSGYIEDPESHALRMAGPVVVTHLDQRNGQVYLGSPKIYAVDNSRSGDPRVVLDEQQAIDVGRVLELPGQKPLPVSESIGALHLPSTPEHTYLPQYGWLLGATQRNDAELQLFKALEQKTQGKFIEAEWVAVFQKVVEKLEPRYHATRIRVSLGQAAPPLVMDDLAEQGRYLRYDIEGQGSQYDLYLSDGATVNLSSGATSRPSTWVLHTDHLSRPDDMRLEPGRLTLGSVVVRVEDKEILYAVNKLDEAYRLDLAGGRHTLVTLSARDHENVSGLIQRLQTLQGLQQLSAPVLIEDLSLSDWPGRGLYYRPADGSFMAIPMDGEDHGDELYQIPASPDMLVIAPSPQREKVLEAAATLAELTAYLNAGDQRFGGRSAGFWSVRPADGLFGNEQCYGDYLRAQYRLEVQRARLQGGYSDTAYPMMLQLLPRHEREHPAPGPRQVKVHRLSINGYPSDDILVLGDPQQGTLLLWVPTSTPALSEFSGVSGLKARVQRLAAADATRQELQEHFPRSCRASSHSALWGYTGTDEALEKLGDNGDWTVIQIDRYPIDDDDVFAALARLKRQSEGG
ncbi:TcdA/TcdB pore-forming domain-containing protein [Pseudomonas sp. MWU12-2037]|uniref:TcdA/TcdB pore-forming domain-containing protein n=1 Tax=Pseudomonas sp. MWU12-2037 TaxID=2928690 RepID=UPI00200F3366|nr:TcdA/TcdB pore-forming domain-containing protein [Pseudomonas sp. MWU12-2037]